MAYGSHAPTTHLEQGVAPSALGAGPGPPWGFASLLEDSNQTTRGVILSYIVANPGVYLRELANDLDFSMGVVQYHIWVLAKEGRVEDCRTGRFRRFFGAGAYQEIERTVISLLKQGTAGQILVLLSKGQPMTHSGLARLLGISSQALSWHVRRLRPMGVIQSQPFLGRAGRIYSLPDRVSVAVGQQLRHESALTSVRLA